MECPVCSCLSATFPCSSCRKVLEVYAFSSLWRERCPVCGCPTLSLAYPCRFCETHYQAYGPLQGLLRELMVRYKVGGQRDLSRLFASLLIPLLPPGAGTCLVPVPASGEGLRRRGFDQGLLLARNMHMPVARLLTRTSRGVQKQQDRRGRAQVAFQVEDRNLPSLRRLVVVDDVITTGSTMRAAIASLEQHYAVPVTGLAVCLA
ncbi:MAG: hypothetical protein MR519_12795 [Spirochaetaceae bacterium]|nr:hypothetical protein [Spirochaetaceae bacterium]